MDDTTMSIIVHAGAETRMSVESLPASGKEVLRIGPYGAGLSVIIDRANLQRLRDTLAAYLAPADAEQSEAA